MTEPVWAAVTAEPEPAGSATEPGEPEPAAAGPPHGNRPGAERATRRVRAARRRLDTRHPRPRTLAPRVSTGQPPYPARIDVEEIPGGLPAATAAPGPPPPRPPLIPRRTPQRWPWAPPPR